MTMMYLELVEKAKREIKSREDYGTARVSLGSCPVWEAGDQINLWAYWQGYLIKDIENGVDILVVGQDWGNPGRNEEAIKRIVSMQNGENVPYYAESPTDKVLTEMFRCFGCDILSKEPGMKLFFTNYSLGYRKGYETGGMTKGLLLKDKELFDDLVAAIRPKMIICLGKLTYEVVSGVKADGFVKRLKTGSPFKTPYPLNRTIPVYGVAHCGARGQRNVGGIEPMRKAWEVMAGEFWGV